MTVGEMLGRMSSAEFSLWQAHYTRNGFDADRLEWATANAGAATAQAMGGKVKAAQIVPKFGRRVSDSRRLIAWLESEAANAERWFDRGK